MRSTALLMMGDAGLWSAGIWVDPSDLARMKQERTGASATTAVGVGDPVGSIFNKGTLGGWMTAPSDGARPTLQQAGGLYYLEAPATGISLDFTSGQSGLFTGHAFSLVYAARWAGTGSILGGTGTSTNENLHSGRVSSGAIRFGLFGNSMDASGAASGVNLVVANAQTNSNRSTRINGAAIASDSNTDLLSNGGLRLFAGPVSQDSAMRLYGLAARQGEITNPRRNRDEQILAGKAGISFTST